MGLLPRKVVTIKKLDPKRITIHSPKCICRKCVINRKK